MASGSGKGRRGAGKRKGSQKTKSTTSAMQRREGYKTANRRSKRENATS